MRRFVCLLTLTVVLLSAAHGQHTIIEGKLEKSALYPGTVHKYHVYVPDAYRSSEEACLFVVLDGIQCNAPQVFDRLMAEKRMPLTIGVFVEPGRIVAKDGTVLRYNRSNEFDMTDDRFARFLAEEVLPAAEQLKTADGRSLHFSAKAADHAIFGLSSGGIASFNAAWWRPDLFQRVFSAVGTFVSFRGGNDLQALVRKTEPLPLRVFLQDGSNDAWNPLFGTWYEGNRILESALRFSGYDLQCDWDDSGHSGTRATQILSDVTTWLWRGWPEEVERGTTANNFLRPFIIKGEDWTESGTISTPKQKKQKKGAFAAIYPDGSHGVKRHEGDDCLWQYLIIDGKPTYGQRFYWLHTIDNTTLQIGPMAFDGDGYLYVTTSIGIQICDQNGRVRAILRTPSSCAPVPTTFSIEDGQLRLTDAQGRTYVRRVNVKAPTEGVRPASQGEG